MSGTKTKCFKVLISEFQTESVNTKYFENVCGKHYFVDLKDIIDKRKDENEVC